MTRMEELLRAAIRDDAAEVAPERIRPLDLSRGGLSRRVRPRRRLVRRLAGWQPLFAAAAVVLVVALSLTLAQVLPGGHRERPGPRPSGSQSAAVSPDTVAPYYAATTTINTKSRGPGDSVPMAVTIHDTGTGARLGTMRPPAPFGTFAFVAGTGSPVTWVVGAQPWHPVSTPGGGADNGAQPVTLFALTYDKAAGKATLTRLPVPALQRNLLDAVALSADGSKLALVDQVNPGTFEVRVYRLSGGSLRTWTQTPDLAKPQIPGMMLSWLADNRTLAIESGTSTQAGVWFIDTSRPSGGLATVGRFVSLAPPGTRPAGQFLCNAEPTAAADGKTIICGGATWRAGTPITSGIGVFSARTGKLSAVRDQRRVQADGTAASADPVVIWASPHGDLIIGADLDGRGLGHVGVLTPDNGVRAIPVPREIGQLPVVGLTEPMLAW